MENGSCEMRNGKCEIVGEATEMANGKSERVAAGLAAGQGGNAQGIWGRGVLRVAWGTAGAIFRMTND